MKATLDLRTLLTEHGELLRQALTTYAEHMEGAATKARTAHEAGRADPELRAAQDGSLMTNHGLKMTAELLTEQAGRAHALRAVLLEMENQLADQDDSIR